MSNQQLFPQTSYPVTGDVQSQPGQPQFSVVALRGVPISSAPPSDRNALVYEAVAGAWTPSGSVLDNDSISVNGTPVSDDYFITVNNNDTYIQVNSSFPPNGKPVLVNGS